MQNVYKSLFSLLILACLSVPAYGQFVVDDVNSGFFRAIQTYTPTDPLSNYASLADLNGNFVIWDFTQYGYEQERDFFKDADDITASSTEYPSASTFANLGANTVEFAEVDGNLIYDYLKVTDTEIRYLGSVTEFDGGGSGQIQYDPGRLDYAFPFTYQDTWTSTSTQTVGGFSSTVTKSVEVVGNGTVVTPFGQFQALQLESQITVDGQTTRQVEWVSERLLDFSATISFDASGNVDDVSLVFFADADDIFRMGPSSGGFFINYDKGFRIEVTQAPSTEGTIGLARYDRFPEGSTFSGSSAQSSDGSTVTPDVIWDEYYFSLTNIGLVDFEVQACFWIENIDRNPDVGGINDIGKLLIVRRSGPGDPWEALDTTVDDSSPSETKLCVSLTSLSQFAIAGEESTNPLPVELSSFTGVTEGEAVVLQWATASETDNAGFHVERRVEDDRAWSTVGFKAGAGTASSPQRYRFRDATVPFDARAVTYRLRQVDVDGTPSLLSPVTLQIGTPSRLHLHPAFPNPARSQVTLRYELPVDGDVRIDVFNALGQRVRSMTAVPATTGRQQIMLPTARLASGVYFVRIAQHGTVLTRRFSVVR